MQVHGPTRISAARSGRSLAGAMPVFLATFDSQSLPSFLVPVSQRATVVRDTPNRSANCS